MAEIKKISTELQLLDKFLDTSGDAGTSGQVLTSTGTGINWVSGGSLPGGPYLPLSAGSSYPLTGKLYAQDDIYISGEHVVKNIDTNLYLDSASGYNVLLRPGGSEKVRIQANGNVGIGDTGPNVKLQVSTSSPTNNVAVSIGDGWVGNSSYHKEGGLLLVSGTSQDATQTGAGIAFQTRNTANTNYWKSSMIMGRDGAIRFTLGGAGTVAGSEDFTILSGGNVGIGTTTPLNSLDVYRATGDASIRIQAETAADSTILKFRNSNADADITVDYTTSNQARMVFNTDNSGGYVPVLSLEANRDTLMYGNVGIGTTSPSAKLSVVGDINFGGGNNDGIIEVSGSGDLIFKYKGSDPALTLDGSDVKAIVHNRLDALSIVTVNNSTNNESILNIRDNDTSSNGHIAFENSSEVTGIVSSGTDFINFRVGDGVEMTATPVLTLEPSQVGIGTTSPDSLLEIEGTTNSSTSSLLRLSRAAQGSSPEKVAGFYSGTSGEKGYITVSNFGTAYNTSSDYRLKENIKPIDNSVERLMS